MRKSVSLAIFLIASEISTIAVERPRSMTIVFHGTKETPFLFTRYTHIAVEIRVTSDVLAVIPPIPKGSRRIQSKRKFRPIPKNVR